MSEYQPMPWETAEPEQFELEALKEDIISVYVELDNYYKLQRAHGINPKQHAVWREMYSTGFEGWKIPIELSNNLDFDEFAVALNSYHDSYTVFGIKNGVTDTANSKLVEAYILRRVANENHGLEYELSHRIYLQGGRHGRDLEDRIVGWQSRWTDNEQQRLEQIHQTYGNQFYLANARKLLEIITMQLGSSAT